MANKLYNDTSVKAIADAIRAKNGTTNTYTVGEMATAIKNLTTGDISRIEWHQCPEAPRNFINDVTYDPNDYSTSQIQNYAPATPLESNTKPIGKTVDGVTYYYNEVPNIATPFASTNAAGTLKPLDALRWINSQTSNVRDLGGWTCDGGTVKYGMLFRGGEPVLADKSLMVDQIGIKHELQLRGTSEEPQPYSLWGIDFSHTTNFVWLSVSESTKPTWKEIFDCVFKTSNKNIPLYFHCAAGADRTGTVAVMLEALLGMSQSDIDKDYELTCFSTGTGSEAQARRRNEDEYKNYISAIKAVPIPEGVEDTFRNHAIYFVASLGFTADEINAYRTAMIDGNPETITLSLDSFTVTKSGSNITYDNNISSVNEFQAYEVNLSADSGYAISNIAIAIGGVDVTSQYWSGKEINLNRSVSTTLNYCTSDNNRNNTIDGQSFAMNLTADSGYTLDGGTVTITMGGVDVSTYYSNGKIAIPNVTGNIVITATAVPSAPVNLFVKTPQYTPTSTATYVDEVAIGGRLSSDGGVKYWKANKLVTRYIAASVGDTITVTTDTDSITETYDWYIAAYDSSKTYINQTPAGSWTFTNENKTGVLIIPTSSPWQGTAFVKINLPYTDINNIVITNN